MSASGSDAQGVDEGRAEAGGAPAGAGDDPGAQPAVDGPRVFISHASEDRAWTDSACRALEERGIKCWMAPRDVPVGANYGEAIIRALDSCRVVVVVFSGATGRSGMVARELERAASRGLAMIPLRVQDGASPPASLEFFLSAAQWIDASRPPRAQRLEELAAAVEAALGAPEPARGPARVKATPDVIGPYRLLSMIGEGGFGEVWLAERREPMVQRVALKIIKPGMDSRAVIARFEQERQALAVMDHPNVAKVLDAGTTPAALGARPYFVMEYVKGEPITAFCDRHGLDLRRRLELFIPVCEAIQHAHHKGIIHRDIKPGNVLVSAGDAPAGGLPGGAAQVKVIDFGVAKAISHVMTDMTLFTEQGRMIGTPEYMSPEQAGGEADIDTRTDVYSLGVLLYELLTGALPFEPRELRAKGYEEIRRIIREVEPPRPSARGSRWSGGPVLPSLPSLSEVGAGGADGAAGAGGSAASGARTGGRTGGGDEAVRELRRELDWVPLKAMAKDRARRYASPLALADDVRNYLEGRVLVAAPESRWYHLRKFASRHRGAIIAGAAMAAVLAAATGVSLVFAAGEARMRRAAEDSNIVMRVTNDFVVDAMLPAIARTRDGFERLVPTLLERAAAELDQPIEPGSDDSAVIRSREPHILAQLRINLAEQFMAVDRPAAARAQLAKAVALQERAFGPEHPRTVTTRSNLARALASEGDVAASATMLEEVTRSWERLGAEPEQLAPTLTSLGSAYRRLGRLQEAERVLVRARALWRGGEGHWLAWECLSALGLAERDLGRLSEAEAMFREALMHSAASQFPTKASGNQRRHLASVLALQGRRAEAEAELIKAGQDLEQSLYPEHRACIALAEDRAKLYAGWPGREADAAEWTARAEELNRRAGGREGGAEAPPG